MHRIGISFFDKRYSLTGDIQDLENGVFALESSLKLLPSDYNAIATVRIYHHLGIAYFHQFEYTGDIRSIQKAISTLQEASDLVPRDYVAFPAIVNIYNDLGIALMLRFKCTRNLEDIDKSIEYSHRVVSVTSPDDIALSGRLSNLGHSLSNRFDFTGDIQDLNGAIDAHQKSCEVTPTNAPERAWRIHHLGSAFFRRALMTGSMKEIGQAIHTLQDALRLAPISHGEIPAILVDLGSSFRFRADHTGSVSDAHEAVIFSRKAVELTPEDNTLLPGRLSHLGRTLTTYFRTTNNIDDINESITFLKQAISLTAPGSNLLPSRLSGHATGLLARARHTQRLSDANEAVAVHQEAVELSVAGDVDLAHRLGDLGMALEHRFKITGDLNDLNNSILQQTKAIELMDHGHALMINLIIAMGNSLHERYEITKSSEDIANAVSQYRRAALFPAGATGTRLNAALKWAKISRYVDDAEMQCIDAYSTALDLLRHHVAWTGTTVQDRHLRLGTYSELSNAAAAAAISFGRLDLAFEWLEQGRSIVWNQLNHLRTPLDDLRDAHPDIAEKVTRLSNELENAGMRNIRLRNFQNTEVLLQDEIGAHHELALEWDTLLTEVRNLPGFDSFLRDMKFTQICESAPAVGTVVLINIHTSRCDALILKFGVLAPLHVPLEQFSYVRAQDMRKDLQRCLSSNNLRLREARSGRMVPFKSSSLKLSDILRELWTMVVKPILDALQLKPSATPPRIWWCTTGPLTFLPIHAAGIYRGNDVTPAETVFDYSISSYTPTVNNILKSTNKHKRRPQFNGLLAVSQSDTSGLPSIPNTVVECQNIQDMFTTAQLDVTNLREHGATIETVLRGMEDNSWIHLACHASQDAKHSTQSAFQLHDGPLNLATIIKKPLPLADFAFLSACQTGTGDEEISEEAVHLAAGMLSAGYRSVIASMWSINDEYAPLVAKEVYSQLLRDAEDGPDSTRSAYALHQATQTLRETLGDSEMALLSWVPFIHLGL
ncbi:CHAT domain-containing protein [Crucibulum laeve]|uniref:CHAT domain-containing protein n=1 Tax=Crucibulum laeve TaxID=68775 RepID=A0A5C3LQE5_9AGAR|nr:CHAT domain-containing protein [Crucibulum laeve]